MLCLVHVHIKKLLCRSEVSWLGSTGRKPKAKPARAYTHHTKLNRPVLITNNPDSDTSEMSIPSISKKVNDS